MVDLGIDRLNKVNLCEHCFNFDLRIAAIIDLAILQKAHLIVSNKRRKIMISSITTTQLTNILYMLPADIKILIENR